MMMEETIIACPNCSQKLRLPLNRSRLQVKCPTCKAQFPWTSPNNQTENNGPTDVSAVIARWQQSLLDLTRRNRLLFFKPGKTFVRLIDVKPDELLERLSSPSGLSFDYAERRTHKPALFSDSLSRPLEDDESNVSIVKGDLSADCAPLELQRRLKGLQKRDIEWDQEQGIKILHLALGFVTWVDEDDYRGRAPLLLLQSTLTKSSPKDPYFLRREDEPETNPTLVYRFGQLGIALPDLGEATISEYLDNVRELIANREEWSVDSDIYLSTFAYNKLAMWQDLEQLRNEGVSHPLILDMAAQGTQVATSDEVVGIPSPFPPDDELAGGYLDDLLELRDQVTVVSADFSQLEAIESARRGQHLVVHGPPGTGKSQTITNIIAALIADNKRVLFVSEKRAALDVVKRNLERCNLGVFCLDMHSKYARKSAVYEQIGESLSADPATHRMKSGRLDELSGLRRQLNEFVRELHCPRKPLGRSVFDMSGVYAKVQSAPSIDCHQLPWIRELDEAEYALIRRVADGLAQRTKEFLEHETSPWRSLRATSFHLGLGDAIRKDLSDAQDEIRRVRECARSVAEGFAVPEPLTADAVDQLKRMVEHFAWAPGIPPLWLEPGCVDECLRQVEEASAVCEERRRLIGETRTWFGERRGWPDFVDLYGRLDHILSDPVTVDSLAVLLGDEWKLRVCEDTEKKIEVVNQLASALTDLCRDLRNTSDLMDSFPSSSWADLEAVRDVAARIAALCPVPASWLMENRRVLDEVSKYKELATKTKEAEEALAADFDESFVDEIEPAIAVRYRTDYQSFTRILRSQYWNDRRFLMGHMQRPRKLSVDASMKFIDAALNVKALRARWFDWEAGAQEIFGSRFRGIATDWNQMEDDVRETGKMATWPFSLSALTDLLTDPKRLHPVLTVVNRLEKNQRLVASQLASLGRPFPLGDTPGSLRELAQLVSAALSENLAVTVSAFQNPQPLEEGLDVVVEKVAKAKKLLVGEREFEEWTSQRKILFQKLYRGYETDWDDVRSRLRWTSELFPLIVGEVSTAVTDQCDAPRSAAVYEASAQTLIAKFEVLLSEHFDERRSQWTSWLSAPFEELKEWLEYLIEHSDEVADQIDYRTASQKVHELFGEGTISRIRAKTDDASRIPDVLQRAIALNWLNAMQNEVPVLRQFSVTSHRTVRERFRSLDEQFPDAIREEVRRRCFSHYPHRGATNPAAGQIGVLYKELMKKRRQMPVRKLFKRVPTLISKLKPCFLMSPLGVSQYLPLITGLFDTVVFDEASQVFPEDAVSSIVRSKQAVVVGDRKQLPPTSFFRRAEGDGDDEDDWEDEDLLVGMESVLDAMVGMVGRGRVGEQYLRVHYRSKSESLIQFSNHKFYGERPLLVFPDPHPAWASKALSAVHVTDGVYEPGKRINVREAERVVDIVFELMDRYGDSQSIGVVALSRAQSDYIQERIDIRRESARHLDGCFSGELSEPFFVKNLENVQGDERDHVVLAIGYGPLTVGGPTPNRFGPINREGGGRRLNVAISRARRTMTLVHSMKASDVTSETDGARLLKAYLEYAASPVDFFTREVQVTSGGEPESPLEASVIAALRERGHRVDSQVGVAGYRIDIGVLSEDEGHYILGIECDGYTYHATPTARDRDWLRQSILEGLGWKIHRVWSTAWIQNPTAELSEIERAIDAARAGQAGTSEDFQPGKTNPITPPIDFVEEEPVDDSNPEAPFNEFQPYKYADLTETRVQESVDLGTAGIYVLSPLVVAIVEIEMPVRVDTIADRIREHWGFKRTGNRIRDRVKEAVTATVREGTIAWDKATTTGKILSRFVVIPSEPVVPRSPGMSGRVRPIEEVSESEIAVGVLAVADLIHGGEPDEIITQTARKFGYERSGATIKARVRKVLSDLLRLGRLQQLQGLIIPASSQGSDE